MERFDCSTKEGRQAVKEVLDDIIQNLIIEYQEDFVEERLLDKEYHMLDTNPRDKKRKRIELLIEDIWTFITKDDIEVLDVNELEKANP